MRITIFNIISSFKDHCSYQFPDFSFLYSGMFTISVFVFCDCNTSVS